jgi:hypothetical protein
MIPAESDVEEGWRELEGGLKGVPGCRGRKVLL